MLRKLLLLILMNTGLLLSCASSRERNIEDSQTHWLRSCRTDRTCGGLDCVCGVCAMPCSGEDTCDVPGKITKCIAPSSEPLTALCGGSAPARVAMCLEPCAGGCPEGQRCTSGACIPALMSAAVVCKQDGQGYALGETMPALDDCHTCTCGAEGRRSCTLIECDAAVPGVDAATPSVDAAIAGCNAGGMRYAIGTQMPAPDGCNTCTCTISGPSSCTERACATARSGGCYLSGQHYELGAKMPSTDGCNSCTCSATGPDSCTEIFCPNPSTAGCTQEGTWYALGETIWSADRCNSCRCTAQGVGQCTGLACP